MEAGFPSCGMPECSARACRRGVVRMLKNHNHEDTGRRGYGSFAHRMLSLPCRSSAVGRRDLATFLLCEKPP
jgi:hypothetical protein